MSVTAMDQIRAVEAEADEVLRQAHAEAKTIVSEAEKQSHALLDQSQQKASERATIVDMDSRKRIADAAKAMENEVAASVKQVNDAARANWKRASELAVRKVLTRLGDI